MCEQLACSTHSFMCAVQSPLGTEARTWCAGESQGPGDRPAVVAQQFGTFVWKPFCHASLSPSFSLSLWFPCPSPQFQVINIPSACFLKKKYLQISIHFLGIFPRNTPQEYSRGIYLALKPRTCWHFGTLSYT